MQARSKEEGLNSCSIYEKKRSRRETKRQKLRKKEVKSEAHKKSHLPNIKNRGRDQSPELPRKRRMSPKEEKEN